MSEPQKVSYITKRDTIKTLIQKRLPLKTFVTPFKCLTVIVKVKESLHNWDLLF